MPKTTRRQRKTTGRVMHEFKHGELRQSRGGRVKSRKQAIAIALSETGASNKQSRSQKRKARRKTVRKEARGATEQQRREGRSSIGAARRKRVSRRDASRRNPTPKKAIRRKTTKRKAVRRGTRKSTGRRQGGGKSRR